MTRDEGCDRHGPRTGDARLATAPPPALEPFNRAGVLTPADVHAAEALGRLTGEPRGEVLLAAALAVRAPRHGHVCVELPSVADSVVGLEEEQTPDGAETPEPVPPDELDWPDPDRWRETLAASPLVAERPEGTPRPDPHDARPLTLVGTRLYLDRYWRYERRVAEVLRRRATRTVDDVDPAAVRNALDRLLPVPRDGQRPDRQRLAAASGMLRSLTVIAGGPGTGKTHTVARLLALILELAEGRPPRIAVAAPTGKAADRLTAALRAAAAELDTDADTRERLASLEGSTLHRLLGWHPGSRTRFRHDRHRRLPHRVVVVDETSMVSLSLMAKLLEALRPSSRLVLVGDPDQLESVEAGAVLGDIVGPAGQQLALSAPTRERLAAATGEPLDAVGDARPDGIDDAVVVLGRLRRYREDSGIAALARAVHAGDADRVVEVLDAGRDDVLWLAEPGDARDAPILAPIRDAVVSSGRDVLAAAQAGEGATALDALDRIRVLCAHRRGPAGVAGWVPLIERWMAADVEGFAAARRGTDGRRWYVGRPVLVTRNTRRLGLFNGDVGVTVSTPDGLRVAFRGAGGVRRFGPSRLEDVETVHAMTIHKSQGSQFAHVAVILPDASSAILTRELLYTAVTRATDRVTVLGEPASVRHAVSNRVARASGLRRTLWGTAAGAAGAGRG